MAYWLAGWWATGMPDELSVTAQLAQYRDEYRRLLEALKTETDPCKQCRMQASMRWLRFAAAELKAQLE